MKSSTVDENMLEWMNVDMSQWMKFGIGDEFGVGGAGSNSSMDFLTRPLGPEPLPQCERATSPNPFRPRTRDPAPSDPASWLSVVAPAWPRPYPSERPRNILPGLPGES